MLLLGAQFSSNLVESPRTLLLVIYTRSGLIMIPYRALVVEQVHNYPGK